MDSGNRCSGKEATRKRYCAKCQKHDLMKEVKGHKNRCFYRWCHCKNCCKIELKRNITRINVKLRRDAALEKELAQRRAQEASSEVASSQESEAPHSKSPTLRDKFKYLVVKKLHNILQKARTLEEARDWIMHGRDMELWPTKTTRGLSPDDGSQPKSCDAILAFREEFRKNEIQKLIHAIHKKAHTLDEARFWIMQELPENDRLSASELCGQGELPPTLDREDGIAEDVTDLRLITAHRDYLEMERRSSVDSLSQPEAPILTAEKDIPSDVRDLRPPHRKDLLDLDRRTSVESCSPIQHHSPNKESSISPEITDLRQITAQKDLLDLDRRSSAESSSPPDLHSRPKDHSDLSSDVTDLRQIAPQKGHEDYQQGLDFFGDCFNYFYEGFFHEFP